jgi:hypothetical protein
MHDKEIFVVRFLMVRTTNNVFQIFIKFIKII